MNTLKIPVIEQDKNGYRHSIEPFLLSAFARLGNAFRVIDVGTGCGVIPLLLVKRQPAINVLAVEIQQSLYETAVKNVAGNGLCDKIDVRHADFVTLASSLRKETFDLIVSNPPYRKINTGRLNPNSTKAIARHELTLNLSALVENGLPLLKNGGNMVLAYPPHRLDEVLRTLALNNLQPGRVRFVHGHAGADAKVFLVEAVKNRPEEYSVEPPLIVYNDDGSYTEEMESIYAAFDYPGRSHRIGQKRGGHRAG